MNEQEINQRHHKFNFDWDQYILRQRDMANYRFGNEHVNYLILKKIGYGQFANVYRGVIMQTKKQVAIKVINLKQIEAQKSSKLRIIKKRIADKQSKIMMKFDSINILKCYQCYQSQDFKFMILEYCNQGTLFSKIKQRGFIPEDQAISILKQIVNGIIECHKLKIIHRDLKPDNILIHNGVYKIGDFGFSKLLAIQEENQLITQTCLGTPCTMAPQVRNKQAYGLKADVWSIGVILFQMLFGQIPFKPYTSYDQVTNAIHHQLQTKNQFNNIKVSPKVIKFLRQVLVVNIQQRLGWRKLIDHQIFKQEGDQDLLSSFTRKIEIKDVGNEIFSIQKQLLVQQKGNEQEDNIEQLHKIGQQRDIKKELIEKQQGKWQIGQEEVSKQQQLKYQHKKEMNQQQIRQTNIMRSIQMSLEIEKQQEKLSQNQQHKGQDDGRNQKKIQQIKNEIQKIKKEKLFVDKKQNPQQKIALINNIARNEQDELQHQDNQENLHEIQGQIKDQMKEYNINELKEQQPDELKKQKLSQQNQYKNPQKKQQSLRQVQFFKVQKPFSAKRLSTQHINQQHMISKNIQQLNANIYSYYAQKTDDGNGNIYQKKEIDKQVYNLNQKSRYKNVAMKKEQSSQIMLMEEKNTTMGKHQQIKPSQKKQKMEKQKVLGINNEKEHIKNESDNFQASMLQISQYQIRLANDQQKSLFQWAKQTYLQCLKTQFIFKKIILLIQQKQLLNMKERQSIEFMYLLCTRCFNNMAPINFLYQVYKYSSVIKELMEKVGKLYKMVVEKWEQYSLMLKKKQDQKIEIIADFAKKLFKRQKFAQKQKYMTGVQGMAEFKLNYVDQTPQKDENRQQNLMKQKIPVVLQDYSKNSQIKYTISFFKFYQQQLTAKNKKYWKQVLPYLNHYQQICGLNLQKMQGKSLKQKVKQIVG